MAELLILLRRLGLPVAVADLMSLTYRFLFLFTETLHTMTLAQASRLGYGTLRQTYRSLALLTVSFFGRVLDRVRRLETGLAARGYQGELRILSVPRRLGRIAVAGIMALELLVVVATICVSAR
jgi:cobalt/nickel transport system permease protein